MQQLPDIRRDGRRGRLLCAAKGGGAFDFQRPRWYRQAVKRSRFVVGKLRRPADTGQPILLPLYPNHERQRAVERIVWGRHRLYLADRLLRETRYGRASVSLLDRNGTVYAQQPADPRSIGKTHPLPWNGRGDRGWKQEGKGAAGEAMGCTRLYAYPAVGGAEKAAMFLSAEYVAGSRCWAGQPPFAAKTGVAGRLDPAVRWGRGM